MYKYTLKPYLLSRKRMFGGMPYGYVNQLIHDAGLERTYEMHTTLSWFSDVTFYSPKRVSHVPARNGILLPVVFYDETEIHA